MDARLYLFVFLFLFNISGIYAQTDTSTILKKKKWYQRNSLKYFAAPAMLVGYGVSVSGNHGLYSSMDVKKDIHHIFPDFSTDADDYLKYVPYGQYVLLKLLGTPSQHDFLNVALLVIKSNIIASAMVFPLKNIVGRERPDRSDFMSFPSGHTADAFVAAAILHQEFKKISPWIGISGYAVAATVGVCRMLNNKHWQSDVLTGAGIGILSVHLAYLTHLNRFHLPKKLTISPMVSLHAKGIGINYRF
ncbi:MAG: phosphatase PAP2 family protein [Sporocytophaga sp.]|nr:phosphatase PAP2 family protein [Sporocytophaga sp.]